MGVTQAATGPGPGTRTRRAVLGELLTLSRVEARVLPENAYLQNARAHLARTQNQ